MMTDTPVAPALVGLGPGPTTGRQLRLAREHQLIGRAAACDIRLTDAQVAERHAVLTVRDGRTWVHDLGTPGGTFVNGQRIGGAPHPLRRGDVVVFGTVALRLEAEPGSATGPVPESTGAPATGSATGLTGSTGRADRRPPPPGPERRPAERFDALLRESASRRAWAGRLLGGGATAFLVGLGLFLAAALGVLADPRQPLGPDLLGVPSGLVGWGISAVGMVLSIAGLGLFCAAAARRRAAERELPWPRSERRGADPARRSHRRSS